MASPVYAPVFVLAVFCTAGLAGCLGADIDPTAGRPVMFAAVYATEDESSWVRFDLTGVRHVLHPDGQVHPAYELVITTTRFHDEPRHIFLDSTWHVVMAAREGRDAEMWTLDYTGLGRLAPWGLFGPAATAPVSPFSRLDVAGWPAAGDDGDIGYLDDGFWQVVHSTKRVEATYQGEGLLPTSVVLASYGPDVVLNRVNYVARGPLPMIEPWIPQAPWLAPKDNGPYVGADAPRGDALYSLMDAFDWLRAEDPVFGKMIKEDACLVETHLRPPDAPTAGDPLTDLVEGAAAYRTGEAYEIHLAGDDRKVYRFRAAVERQGDEARFVQTEPGFDGADTTTVDCDVIAARPGVTDVSTTDAPAFVAWLESQGLSNGTGGEQFHADPTARAWWPTLPFDNATALMWRTGSTSAGHGMTVEVEVRSGMLLHLDAYADLVDEAGVPVENA